jgi:hypothetical protein
MDYLKPITLSVLVYLSKNTSKTYNLAKLIPSEDLKEIYKDLEDIGFLKLFLCKFKGKCKWSLLPRGYIKDYFEIILKIDEKKKISKFIEEYIIAFENNQLIGESNYYSYEKHMEIVADKWHKSFKNFGKNITVLTKDEIKDKYFRPIELIMSLEGQGYVDIKKVFLDTQRIKEENDFFDIRLGGDGYRDRFLLGFNTYFIKSPAEISDIHKYWISYGDLRANEQDGVAHYKNIRYPFKSTTGKAFKLLCFLIKNHGRYIPITEATKFVEESEIKLSKKVIKERIKGYIKEIKENLQINKDKSASLDIKVTGENIILISNPL